MKASPPDKRQARRLMYVENTHGDIDGAPARIGYVEFSRSGKSLYYRGRMLTRTEGGGGQGTYVEIDSGEEYRVSAIKRRGSSVYARDIRGDVVVDEDAAEEYRGLEDET